jgi:hypothetical protein
VGGPANLVERGASRRSERFVVQRLARGEEREMERGAVVGALGGALGGRLSMMGQKCNALLWGFEVEWWSGGAEGVGMDQWRRT